MYATDAAQMLDKVKVIASAPEGSLATKVIYPVGMLQKTEFSEEAKLFIEFLKSKEAIDVFIENGFKSNL